MVEEASLRFISRKTDDIRNYLLDELKHNDLMSKKCKKTYKYLDYFENLLILASTVTGCVWISAFTSLAAILVRTTSSAVGIKICTVTVGIKKYQSIVKEKKKHDKIVLLGNDQWNTTEVLICSALMDSYICHDKFASVNKVLKEYHEIKEEVKNLETSVGYTI